MVNVPDSFHTRRLLIRSPLPGDGPELNAAVVESQPELALWLPWAQQSPTLEESEERVRSARAAFLDRTDLTLLLFLKGTRTLVGSSGLHRFDWRVPRFEIGYWRRTSFAGQGLITEAVQGITAFAFQVLDARRLEIRCDPRNLRSRRVAERSGYQLEAELRNYAVDTRGSVRNTLVFSLIPEEHELLVRQAAGPLFERMEPAPRTSAATKNRE